jgi:biotin carboxyl carrier protein
MVCRLTQMQSQDDAFKIKAETHASVYKIPTQRGNKIKVGDVLLVLEAMKMEINLVASAEHEGLLVRSIAVGTNDVVKPGDTLILLSRAEEAAA